jgi:hypothetical protein
VIIEKFSYSLIKGLADIALKVFFYGQADHNFKELEPDQLSVWVHPGFVGGTTGESRHKNKVNIRKL